MIVNTQQAITLIMCNSSSMHETTIIVIKLITIRRNVSLTNHCLPIAALIDSTIKLVFLSGVTEININKLVISAVQEPAISPIFYCGEKYISFCV